MKGAQLGVLIVLILSLTANTILGLFIATNTRPSSPTGISPDSYPYLSKRLFSDTQNDFIINFVALRKKLATYFDTHAIGANATNSYSIYFEYLPSGISIGINEKDTYVAASLLKVPIIMGVYKYIESGKLQEDSVLTLKDSDLDPLYGTLWKKGVGAKVTVLDAIKLTLAESDNTAKSVLFNNVPLQTLIDVYDYLDIPNDADANTPVVSAKNYSSILRSLYLSTYLSMENSQKILTHLTESAFNDKLAAGIPDSVRVAHKIGVHDINNPKGSVYTACGIVYVPKRPYILCMMARDTEENVRPHMQEISRIVYDYVSTTQIGSGK